MRPAQAKRAGPLASAEPSLVLDHPPLSRAALAAQWVSSLFPLAHYHFHDTLSSTNTEVARLTRHGAPAGTLVLADSQTQGRGRLGRSWLAGAGANLTFSMLLRPALEPRLAAQLTLLTGWCAAQTLIQLGVGGVRLKWPNDLLIQGRKVAGILTEMETQGSDIRHVIVGIGLNINDTTTAWPEPLRTTAISLREATGRVWDRSQIFLAFLAVFAAHYARFVAEGWSVFRADWLELAQLTGQAVRISLIQEQFTATALDLDEEGFLLVQTSAGHIQRVVAGDVVLL